ncbi:MAG: hypothetical protein CM15mP86_07080 [Gammaproteobacteria bacterium]|nr:MAG: hypothetical protein CM15mP86_07080 [Gammaproteobacteria bacterium]
MHAVERQKQLLASALGYKTNISNRDYGISKTNFKNPNNLTSISMLSVFKMRVGLQNSGQLKVGKNS